jgi:two-component system, LytTR family, sensor kinase
MVNDFKYFFAKHYTRKPVIIAFAVVGFWTAFALLSLRNMYDNIEHTESIPFPVIVWRQIALWETWVFFTGIAIVMGIMFPLERGRLRVSIPAHGIACVCVCVMHALAMLIWQDYAAEYGEQIIPTQLWKLGQSIVAMIDVLIYAMIVFVLTAIQFARHAQERELRAAHLETQLLQAEFSALKMQMHPHFLFNALNSITALIREVRTQEALQAVNQLGTLLRAALDDTREDIVELYDEIEFVRKYIAIEQIRFHDRLQVDWNISEEARYALVPTLILQPLVENAVKHGLSGRIGAHLLRISAHRVNNALFLEVEDDGAGLGGMRWTPNNAGVGLRNVLARLHFLYTNRATLTLVAREPFGAIARIELPFERTLT